MKNFFFTSALFMLGGFSVLPLQAQIDSLKNEVIITHLERDSFYNFYFSHDVKVSSAYDENKHLWKVKLEEQLNQKNLPSPHEETLWLKLDPDCKPKSWDLQKFKINGHNFTVFLLKRKQNKR